MRRSKAKKMKNELLFSYEYDLGKKLIFYQNILKYSLQIKIIKQYVLKFFLYRILKNIYDVVCTFELKVKGFIDFPFYA